MRCPICKKPVEEPGDAARKSAFPFCSDRCKLIDLGRWFDEKYQIPVVDPEGDDTETEPNPDDSPRRAE